MTSPLRPIDQGLHLVRWAAEVCEWHQSGEMSVFNLLRAWDYAYTKRKQRITVHDIKVLGHLVEPETNRVGWRDVPITVGIEVLKNQDIIPYQLIRFASMKVPPMEWLQEFLLIYPFLDGNGRVANLLFNWRNSSLAPDAVRRPGFLRQEQPFKAVV